jgi:hypothetical protein
LITAERQTRLASTSRAIQAHEWHDYKDRIEFAGIGPQAAAGSPIQLWIAALSFCRAGAHARLVARLVSARESFGLPSAHNTFTAPEASATMTRSVGALTLGFATCFVLILGLSFGGWAWLVAAGIAPLILSTLPCLIMCGLGAWMMCRSNQKQSTTPREATDAATSSAVLGVIKTNRSEAGGANCCPGSGSELPRPQVKQA